MAWFKAVKPKEEYSNLLKEKSADYEANIGKMPVLLELGSPTCGPCRKMTPIINEIKKEYKNKIGHSYNRFNKKSRIWRKI